MTPQKTWRLNGIPFKDCEMKTIALRIMDLTYEQIGDCLCRSKHTIHTYIENIHLKLEVHHVQGLVVKAINAGFDDKGHYKGEPVLTPDELERAQKFVKQLR